MSHHLCNLLLTGQWLSADNRHNLSERDRVEEAHLLCVHSDLQLEYLDLYLIHWPLKLRKGSGFPPRQEDFLPLDIKSTWEALEHTVELGLTRAIGVANFSSKRLESLLQYAKIQPAVDQVKEELAIYYGSITINTMHPPLLPMQKNFPENS